MKRLISVLGIALLSQAALAAPVRINFTNTGNQQGTIRIAVFNDPKYFPDNEAGIIQKAEVAVTKNQNSAQLTINLPAGDYVISAFLDESTKKHPRGDKKLNTAMGIPKERFGFSNNPKIKMRAPHFSECDIRIENEGAHITIRLNKLL